MITGDQIVLKADLRVVVLADGGLIGHLCRPLKIVVIVCQQAGGAADGVLNLRVVLGL